MSRTRAVQTRLTEEELRRLRAACRGARRTVSNQVRQLILAWLREREGSFAEGGDGSG